MFNGPLAIGSASCEQSGNVFEEDVSGSALADDAFDVGPEVPRVIVTATLSGLAEGLAREARSDDIHDATPRSAVEGMHVIPDRRAIQGAIFHARDQDRGGSEFMFNVADSPAG